MKSPPLSRNWGNESETRPWESPTRRGGLEESQGALPGRRLDCSQAGPPWPDGDVGGGRGGLGRTILLKKRNLKELKW